MPLENMGSINHLVLSDQVLWLGRRGALSCLNPKGCFGSEDVLFEEILLDELFQVLSEGPTMNGLVSLVVIVGAIFFYSRKRRIVPDWSRALNTQLVLKGVEDLGDRELQRSEMLFHQIVSSEWI